MIYAISLVVAFVGLNLADMMLTRSILKAGGREANPFVRAIINRFGFNKAIAVKMSITGVIVSLSLLWGEYASMLVLSGILGGVCVWNSYVLHRKEPEVVQ